MSQLDDFRAAKDAFFRDSQDSPLTSDQRRTFSGFAYFTEDAGLRFIIEADVVEQPELAPMARSGGDIVMYERWATLRFEVDGESAELTAFREPGSEDLFVPFLDATAASGETYGAGRYVEPERLPGGKVLLDFNLAYNPYCAYNERWNCPLTPQENILQVSIRAGEKAFTQGHQVAGP